MDAASDRVQKPSRFAKFDRPAFVADGRPVRHRKPATGQTILALVGVAAVWAVVALLGGLGILIAGVIILIELTAYVVWRRRRNRALTGSPTRWPDQDL